MIDRDGGGEEDEEARGETYLQIVRERTTDVRRQSWDHRCVEVRLRCLQRHEIG